jgi:hypothetical protein
MTGEQDERQDPSVPEYQEAVADMAVARREAISLIAAENLEAFAQTRRVAQRNLVHTLENAATAADVRHLLALFAIEASRGYAARALFFDARVDEPSILPTTD